MSLDLRILIHQVQQLGHAVAAENDRISQIMPIILEAFEAAAKMPAEDIKAHIKGIGNSWTGAIPTDEPINLIHPAPSDPEIYNVVGADGSQIYPDRHEIARYALINVGSILIRNGSGEPPLIRQEGKLIFDVYDAQNDDLNLESAAIINGRRDVAEMEALASWGEIHSQEKTLLLLDNSLLLWLALRLGASSKKVIDKLLHEYLSHLERIRLTGVALAGFIDRPRSTNVLTLLEGLGIVERDKNGASLFEGVEDRRLFAHILPTECRSAVFRHPSPLNNDFRTAGHEVFFFYLHTGPDKQIVRVEVPVWVGEDDMLLDLVHAGILQQCRTSEGFPYALIRAHELAVVTHRERGALNDMIRQEIEGQGVEARISVKSQTKRWTSSNRRHRL